MSGRYRYSHIVVLFLLTFLLCLYPTNSSAQKFNFLEERPKAKRIFETNEALIHADMITYKPESSLVIAEGNVEITQKGRILLADKVTYDQKTNTVNAYGNISLLEPDGTVLFADNVELKKDLKQGIITDFRARFGDESLLAANSAVRVNEDITELEHAVYSPCKVCEDYAGKIPLWQISAEKVKVDNEEQKVTYKNAFFETYGVPVLYTPYLSHATPGADRKSGLMIPSYSKISTLGDTVRMPYYYSIAPNIDTTITPIYTSEEGMVMAGEFRHKIKSGQYEINGSITNPDKRDDLGNKTNGSEVRGHIDGYGNFDINDTWSWGFSGKRSTDDTYLQRYKFGDEDILTSSAHVQELDKNDYFSIEALTFQGLNVQDDPDTTPLILPLANSHIQTTPGWRNSWWTVDSNLLALTRTEGVDSRRISSKAAWQIPYTTKNGHVFSAKASIRGDAYNVNDVPDPSDQNQTLDGFAGRAIPEVEVGWSWPLARPAESYNIIVEPVTQLILSPHGNNPSKIPNEDSQEIEISDMNLFSSNHFTGLDLVEGGPRANYGIRSFIDVYEYTRINMLFGQNYRAKKESKFEPESGLDKNFSDYVGRFGFSVLDDNIDLSYRFRLDRENLDSRRSEVTSGYKAGPFSANVGYLLLNEGTPDNPTFDREEITTDGKIQISDFWSVTGGARKDLSDNGGFIGFNSGLHFVNECVIMSLLYNHDFTSDRDIEPSQSITIQLFLKNLN